MEGGEDRVRAFMARVGERMADPNLTGALPDLAVRMAVDDLGSWLLTVRDGRGRAVLEPRSGERPPVECECRSTLAALERIATGRLKPVRAALSGQIRLSGDRARFAHLRDVLGGAVRAALAAERAAAAASPGLRVEVAGFAVIADGVERYATYELAVREGGQAWRLRVRWSDARQLELRLAASLRRAGSAKRAGLGAEEEEGRAALPRLVRWADLRRSLRAAFLERRRARLQGWLSDILSALSPEASVLRGVGPAPLLLFLRPPAGPGLAVARARAAGSPARSPRAGARRRASAEGGEAGDGEDDGGSRAATPDRGYATPQRAAAPARGEESGADAAADAAIELAELEQEIARAQALPVGWAREGSAARAQIHARLQQLEAAAGVGRGASRRKEALGAFGGFAARAWRNPLGAALGCAHTLLALCCSFAALRRAAAAAAEGAAARAVEADGGAGASADARLLGWLGGAALVGMLNAPAAAAMCGMLARTHAPPLARRLLAGGAAPPPASERAAWPGACGAEEAEREEADELAVELDAPAAPLRERPLSAPTLLLTSAAGAPAAGSAAPPPAARQLPPSALLLPRALGAARALPLSALSLLLLLVLFRRLLRRSLLRLYRIYLTAAVTIGAYAGARRALRATAATAAREARAYARLDGLVAPFACAQFGALRSLWVKFGQYVGSRTDIVTPGWAGALEALQDDLPADSDAHVRSTVASELGQPLHELFEAFELEPLASASVAQVHVATLRGEGGRRVAVKLQHEGIAELMVGDFVAALRIARFVTWCNPGYEPIQTVLQAWAREVDRELDFQNEAAHLRAVGANLAAAGVRALVPQPVHGLVGARCFCMEYVDGFKLTDAQLLGLHGVDREALMVRVTLAYACQLFTFGKFNADPHPVRPADPRARAPASCWPRWSVGALAQAAARSSLRPPRLAAVPRALTRGARRPRLGLPPARRATCSSSWSPARRATRCPCCLTSAGRSSSRTGVASPTVCS